MRKVVVTALLVGATIGAAQRMRDDDERPYDIAFLPSSSVARWMSLGHPTLLANLWWLRVVQYIGDPHAERRGWEKLYPAVDLVTDLDARHGYAYQVAGTILGTADRVTEANAILEKGIRNLPGRYILPYLRAFNAFFYDGDYAAAGHFFEIAARVPGAPDRLRQNVLAMYVKGRRADAAIAFLEHALDSAQDPDTRNAVREQLRQAYLERAAGRLDDALGRYVHAYGWPPLTPGLLVATGFLDALPEDPYGGTFVLGPDGRYESTVHPRRFGKPEKARPRIEPGIDALKR
jgi:tetratricopeptide (TPR) repeat protein